VHKIVTTEDGSNTAFSSMFNEHYHSTQDGALTESLQKHVIPALQLTQDKESLTILDICFGLGYNTLCTLYYCKKNNITKKIKIVSPELDGSLLEVMKTFNYPKEFDDLKEVITSIASSKSYHDKQFSIEVVIGDAREYIKRSKEQFDVVYQDAFSPSVNPLLWTKEYFESLNALMMPDAIVTTYSIALKIRLALYHLGLNLYLNKGEKKYRDATVATRQKLANLELVNMEHKISCNPDISMYHDKELVSV
jgi:tRNA U34 5-methylaminomethyl-2-thiouridine-forming methyltransferase MnmC